MPITMKDRKDLVGRRVVATNTDEGQQQYAQDAPSLPSHSPSDVQS